MSESKKWEKIGEAFGRGLAAAIEKHGPALADAIRDLYASLYGKCRRCDQPLGGESPEKICEPCHAAEVLEAANGGPTKADA